jgi:hypothetical protein
VVSARLHLEILPAPQRRLWPELPQVPSHFTLYGGTALALRLAHRRSVDFDFFSRRSFDPDALCREIGFLQDAERIQVAADTLTCRVRRRGPILVSFFGGVGLGLAAARERLDVGGEPLFIASLLDLAGTKAGVVQKRAEAKDYLDIAALIEHGVGLATILAAGRVVHGPAFNPLITLKALSYFDDVPSLPAAARRRLAAAVDAVDPDRLPALSPFRPGPREAE